MNIKRIIESVLSSNSEKMMLYDYYLIICNSFNCSSLCKFFMCALYYINNILFLFNNVVIPNFFLTAMCVSYLIDIMCFASVPFANKLPENTIFAEQILSGCVRIEHTNFIAHVVSREIFEAAWLRREIEAKQIVCKNKKRSCDDRVTTTRHAKNAHAHNSAV